jgi:3-oxoacyl-[acyl-carrier protein] reductase
VAGVTDGPLAGRAALVTGVSRRIGIGFAVCERLRALGADVLAHGWTPHDAGQPWGADPGGVEAALSELGVAGYVEADLADPAAPAALVAEAGRRLGPLDIVVANHADSAPGTLAQLTAERVDAALAVNVRATLLLAQAFAAAHAGRPDGRLVLLTSGQQHEAMPGELPYVASKAAIAGMTATLAHDLLASGIVANAVNPGPTDTGYAPPDAYAAVAAQSPLERWGEPVDAARLIAWLCTADAGWIIGQVLDSDGGWSKRPR